MPFEPVARHFPSECGTEEVLPFSSFASRETPLLPAPNYPINANGNGWYHTLPRLIVLDSEYAIYAVDNVMRGTYDHLIACVVKRDTTTNLLTLGPNTIIDPNYYWPEAPSGSAKVDSTHALISSGGGNGVGNEYLRVHLLKRDGMGVTVTDVLNFPIDIDSENWSDIARIPGTNKFLVTGSSVATNVVTVTGDSITSNVSTQHKLFNKYTSGTSRTINGQKIGAASSDGRFLLYGYARDFAPPGEDNTLIAGKVNPDDTITWGEYFLFPDQTLADDGTGAPEIKLLSDGSVCVIYDSYTDVETQPFYCPNVEQTWSKDQQRAFRVDIASDASTTLYNPYIISSKTRSGNTKPFASCEWDDNQILHIYDSVISNYEVVTQCIVQKNDSAPAGIEVISHEVSAISASQFFWGVDIQRWPDTNLFCIAGVSFEGKLKTPPATYTNDTDFGEYAEGTEYVWNENTNQIDYITGNSYHDGSSFFNSMVDVAISVPPLGFIRKQANSIISLFAGSETEPGDTDGPVLTARFIGLEDIATVRDGSQRPITMNENLFYVVDGTKLRMIHPCGFMDGVEEIPFGSEGWSYVTGTTGFLSGFQEFDFDDSAWAVGTMPFGDLSCRPQAVTDWPTAVGSEILVRRLIYPLLGNKTPHIEINVDDNVQVWWNGTTCYSEATNYARSYLAETIAFDVTDNLTMANVLAIRARDIGLGCNGLDVRVTFV